MMRIFYMLIICFWLSTVVGFAFVHYHGIILPLVIKIKMVRWTAAALAGVLANAETRIEGIPSSVSRGLNYTGNASTAAATGTISVAATAHRNPLALSFSTRPKIRVRIGPHLDSPGSQVTHAPQKQRTDKSKKKVQADGTSGKAAKSKKSELASSRKRTESTREFVASASSRSAGAPPMKRSRRANATAYGEDEMFIDTEDGSIAVSALTGETLTAEDRAHLDTVLRVLLRHELGWLFSKPVDPVALGIADYYDIIPNPMDLGTISQRLKRRHYRKVSEFEGEVHLVFRNAVKYNGPEHEVGRAALALEEIFHAEMDERLGDRRCTVSALADATAQDQQGMKFKVRKGKPTPVAAPPETAPSLAAASPSADSIRTTDSVPFPVGHEGSSPVSPAAPPARAQSESSSSDSAAVDASGVTALPVEHDISADNRAESGSSSSGSAVADASGATALPVENDSSAKTDSESGSSSSGSAAVDACGATALAPFPKAPADFNCESASTNDEMSPSEFESET